MDCECTYNPLVKCKPCLREEIASLKDDIVNLHEVYRQADESDKEILRKKEAEFAALGEAYDQVQNIRSKRDDTIEDLNRKIKTLEAELDKVKAVVSGMHLDLQCVEMDRKETEAYKSNADFNEKLMAGRLKEAKDLIHLLSGFLDPDDTHQSEALRDVVTFMVGEKTVSDVTASLKKG